MQYNKVKKNDLHSLPVGFFNDNDVSNKIRNNVIRNQVRIADDVQGDLEKTFFSEQNIDIINKQLIMKIYEMSKKNIKIAPQSKEELLIVMRYVFIEYARHLPYDLVEQIRELNYSVIGEILPSVWTNIHQKIDYLAEINNPRQINPLPVNVNTRNQNLQSISSIFHS